VAAVTEVNAKSRTRAQPQDAVPLVGAFRATHTDLVEGRRGQGLRHQSYGFAEHDLAAVTRTCVYDRAGLLDVVSDARTE